MHPIFPSATAMTDRSKTSTPLAEHKARAAPASVETFLALARGAAPPGATRIVFALDATMSRQPTWTMASEVQGAMFDAAASLGGLAVQLAYFRGLGECQASRWVSDPAALHDLMRRIACRGGHTQIARLLGHVRSEARRLPVKALIYVGAAKEEPLDALSARAGELGLVGVKAFMFHEGADPSAGAAYREVARLTGGAYLPFDAGSPARLAALLKAIVSYAGGGAGALERLAATDSEARRLIGALSSAR